MILSGSAVQVKGNFWVVVGLVEEAVDGDLEVDNGAEDAAFQAPLRELREEALDGIEPGAGGRHEVEGEALVAAEPGAHLGMLVGGVVVEDHMDALAGRDIGLALSDGTLQWWIGGAACSAR